MVIDLSENKGIPSLLEEDVNGRNQPFFGAPVPAEGKRAVRIRCRCKIGEHIRTTEPVDRLLWVSYIIQVVFTPSKDLLENIVLSRIRILEFINQSSAIPLADFMSKSLSAA